MAKGEDSTLDFSEVNKVRRYINDYEYKLDWEIPHYSKRWYEEITTNLDQRLTQEHLDLYVASVKLIIAIDEKKNEENRLLKYYPLVNASNINSIFYKVYTNQSVIKEVIQTFHHMEQATTDKQRLELYLSLHTIDETIIDHVYSHAKSSVDQFLEEVKRLLHEFDAIDTYQEDIQKLNDLKFALIDTIDQEPFNDPVKNVETYIEQLDTLHHMIIDDLIEEIDAVLQLEERSNGLRQSLEDAKRTLHQNKEVYPYYVILHTSIQEALHSIERYKAAPPIQPLKEVIHEVMKQYEEWLQMPLTENEKRYVEEAIANAQSTINNAWIQSDRDLNWEIQKIQEDYQMVEQYLQRHTLSIITSSIKVDATFVPIALQIQDDFQTVDTFASNITVKVTSEQGLSIPEIVTFQQGKAQVLFSPKANESPITTITAEVIDAPLKYKHLIGQKVTKKLLHRL